jgi:hypothetical protein
LELVHQLGLYVHGKLERSEFFKSVRALKNPGLNILPTKDVPTRWNSKELAIDRVLKLKATILLYCQKSKGCPLFTEDTFDVLGLIRPALRIFADLTATYSMKEAHAYRVLPDLHFAITELERMAADHRLTAERARSFEVAAAKIKKYMTRFLQNDWICAAYAFHPENRESALERLLDAYGQRRRKTTITRWIKDRLSMYTKDTEEATASPAPSTQNSQQDRGRGLQRAPNPFSSRRNANNAGETAIFEDAWALWNAEGGSKFLEDSEEGILPYWKRMSRIQELRPLAHVARDVLGLPASSTSVERLFSQAGLMVTKKRGSLSPAMVVKQTCLKVWTMEGNYTPGDVARK